MSSDLALPLDPPAVVRLYTGPDDLPQLEAFLARPRPYTAVDVETTGTGWGDTVRTVQLGDDREAWVLLAEHREAIAMALGRCRWLLAWNAAFDSAHLARLLRLDYAEHVERYLDTAVLAGVLDPRTASQGGVGRGLKPWAAHLCGAVAVSFDTDRAELFRRQHVDWASADPTDPVMLRYAGADPILTYRVHRHLAPQLQDRREVVRREQRLARIVARMRHRGLALDPDRAEEAFVSYRRTYAEKMSILHVHGVTSVFKPAEITAALQTEGHTLTERTVKGALTAKRGVLEACAGNGSQVAAAVLAAKTAKRFADTYVDAFRQAARHDGAVHASIRSIGARTRRMSVSQPPLQQVPKDDLAVRGIFRPTAGIVVVRADYASMELRYMAHVSRDRRLIRDLETGAAIFEELAVSVWGEQARGSKALRNLAKRVVYATCYGAGVARIVEITGLSEGEAQRIRNAWWTRYPNLRALFYDLRDQVRAAGAVDLPRTGRLPASPDKAFTGLNLVVQGGCRDAFAERILTLADTGLADHMALPVHDELVCTAGDDQAHDLRDTLGRLMPITDTLVPIPVEASHGRSWGEAYTNQHIEHQLTDPATDDEEDTDDDPE